MSEFMDKLRALYEEKKDLKNPPSYLNNIKQILEINSSLKQKSENKENHNMQT